MKCSYLSSNINVENSFLQPKHTHCPKLQITTSSFRKGGREGKWEKEGGRERGREGDVYVCGREGVRENEPTTLRTTLTNYGRENTIYRLKTTGNIQKSIKKQIIVTCKPDFTVIFVEYFKRKRVL